MNQKDTHPDYKGMYGLVCARFQKTAHFKHGPFDETYFTMRVYESAKEIIQGMRRPVNIQQILVASIIHDIGKTQLKSSLMFVGNDELPSAHEEWHRHPSLSVPIAARILKRMGHSDEFIKDVSYLIENHAQRGHRIRKKRLELQILQDADLIADIGFAGFIRPFLYSGKFSKQSVVDSIRYVQDDDRTNNLRDLNLDVSKAIARRELKIQKNLAGEILKDIDSDLL